MRGHAEPDPTWADPLGYVQGCSFGRKNVLLHTHTRVSYHLCSVSGGGGGGAAGGHMLRYLGNEFLVVDKESSTREAGEPRRYESIVYKR